MAEQLARRGDSARASGVRVFVVWRSVVCVHEKLYVCDDGSVSDVALCSGSVCMCRYVLQQVHELHLISTACFVAYLLAGTSCAHSVKSREPQCMCTRSLYKCAVVCSWEAAVPRSFYNDTWNYIQLCKFWSFCEFYIPLLTCTCIYTHSRPGSGGQVWSSFPTERTRHMSLPLSTGAGIYGRVAKHCTLILAY
jgi:hypothetical protein